MVRFSVPLGYSPTTEGVSLQIGLCIMTTGQESHAHSSHTSSLVGPELVCTIKERRKYAGL